MADEYVTKAEYSVMVKRVEDEEKRQNHRLEELEGDVKEIHQLAISVNSMAVSVDNLTKEIAKQSIRLEKIEAEPAENWNKAVWVVVSALIGMALGALFKSMGM